MNSKEPRDPLLASRFDALKNALARIDTPHGVEKELLAAFAMRHPARRWYQRLPGAGWKMAGVLASTATIVMVFLLATQSPARIEIAEGQPLIGLDDGVAFIALDSLDRIEQEEHPRMVETDVPRTALASLGVPVTPENAGDSVHAEMLVSADGEPLALRLTSNQ